MEATGNLTSHPNEGSGTLCRTVDRASTGAHDVIDKVSDATRPMVDRMAAGAHQAVDKLAGAAETLGVKGGQLKSVQVRAMAQCRGYVAAHPVTSLGIAVAAGYLLSRLLSSR